MKASFFLIAAVVALSGCGGSGPAEQATPTHSVATTTEAAAGEQDIEEAGATPIDITGDWLSEGAGAIWLSNPPAREIYRLDPESGETVATVPVPQLPCGAPDFGFGALWTATCDKQGLARIDPATNRISRHLPIGVGAVLEGGEASVAAGEGAVWVVLKGACPESCLVARVDPRSFRVVARIPVRQGAAAVRVGEGAVWVTNPRKSIVQKIDPARNRVVATTPSARRRVSSRSAKAGSGRSTRLTARSRASTRRQGRSPRRFRPRWRVREATSRREAGPSGCAARGISSRKSTQAATRSRAATGRPRAAAASSSPPRPSGSRRTTSGRVWRLPLDR